MAMPGIYELLIIAFIILFLFGAKRIPEMMRGLGIGIRELKEGILYEGDEDDRRK